MIANHNVHIIHATNGSIDIGSVSPGCEGHMTVTSDIITGNIHITADNNIEVIRIVEQGPQGPKGDKGEPGLSGAGKPFYEVIPGELFESTSSISIIGDISVTGSGYFDDILIVGENIVSSPTSVFTVTSHATGSMDIVKFGTTEQEYLKINNEGVVVFGQTSGSVPDPVSGGIYFSGDAFYVGL